MEALSRDANPENRAFINTGVQKKLSKSRNKKKEKQSYP